MKALLEGDTNTLKISLESLQNNIEDSTIIKYAETFKKIVLIHLINIIADITVANGPKGKNLHLWHMPKDRNKEKLIEEKEQLDTT